MNINSLHTEVIGTGPDLVLLHGTGTHSRVWIPLAEKLKVYFRLTLIDLPGCGKSPLLNEDNDFHLIVQKILNVTPDSAYWIGWSFGGLIGIQSALTAPKKVKKLMTFATTPRIIEDENWPGLSLGSWKWINTFLSEEDQDDVPLIEMTFALADYSVTTQFNPQIKTHLKQSAETSSVALKNIFNLVREIDLRAQLSHLQCPSFHIFGQQDPMVSPLLLPLLKELAPEIQIQLIEGAGHVPFLTHDEECLKIIRDFFQ